MEPFLGIGKNGQMPKIADENKQTRGCLPICTTSRRWVIVEHLHVQIVGQREFVFNNSNGGLPNNSSDSGKSATWYRIPKLQFHRIPIESQSYNSIVREGKTHLANSPKALPISAVRGYPQPKLELDNNVIPNQSCNKVTHGKYWQNPYRLLVVGIYRNPIELYEWRAIGNQSLAARGIFQNSEMGKPYNHPSDPGKVAENAKVDTPFSYGKGVKFCNTSKAACITKVVPHLALSVAQNSVTVSFVSYINFVIILALKRVQNYEASHTWYCEAFRRDYGNPKAKLPHNSSDLGNLAEKSEIIIPVDNFLSHYEVQQKQNINNINAYITSIASPFGDPGNLAISHKLPLSPTTTLGHLAIGEVTLRLGAFPFLAYATSVGSEKGKSRYSGNLSENTKVCINTVANVNTKAVVHFALCASRILAKGKAGIVAKGNTVSNNPTAKVSNNFVLYLALGLAQNLPTHQSYCVGKIRHTFSYGCMTKWLTFLNVVSAFAETQYRNPLVDSGNLAKNATELPNMAKLRCYANYLTWQTWEVMQNSGRAVLTMSEIPLGCT